jgi:hypothetical protein
MQRERLLQDEQWRDEPDSHEAERYRELNDREDTRKALSQRCVTVATTEPNEQHGADNRQRQQSPVCEAVRRERRVSRGHVHVTTLGGRRCPSADAGRAGPR